jgi:hypothetical protein
MKTAFAIALLGLATLAQPAVAVTKTFSSGPIGPETGFVGVTISCAVHNAGADPIVLTSRSILNLAGVAVAITNDGCGNAALAPKKSCIFLHTDDMSTPHVCRVKAKGATVKVRGTATFRSNSTIIANTPIE